MVYLVLDNLGTKSRKFLCLLLPLGSRVFELYTARSFKGGIVIGKRKAAFEYRVAFFLLCRLFFGNLDYFGVNNRDNTAPFGHYEEPEVYPDLGGGQSHTLGILLLGKGIRQIPDKVQDFSVDFGNRL